MSIDEILIQQGRRWANNADKPFAGNPEEILTRTAKKQLLELLESCKPENSWREGSDLKHGFDDATQQYHSNIRKLFEVER